jgi:SAM-dependent methyltransferase
LIGGENATMRDPRGAVTLTDATAVRSLQIPLAPGDFLFSTAAKDLVRSGRLLAYDVSRGTEIVSPRIPFVSHPYEWTDQQFVDAARLTLEVSRSALQEGRELKDASAWNIIFTGCRPVFCDHTSFAPIDRREWWAFGQFVRHFVLPLLVARKRGLNAHTAFLMSRDGLAPGRARRVLGARRFLTRYWPLMVANRRKVTGQSTVRGLKPSFHANLYVFGRWLIDGVAQVSRSAGRWSDYVTCRSHYEPTAVELKRSTVGRWLAVAKGEWVVDIGCNTGEFSRLARATGARVIAIDSDHSSVETLYSSAKGDPDLYPVLAELDDLGAGRGWCGSEVPGLLARLSGLCDVVLMLAVIHHLAIARSIPLDQVAELAARLTNRYAIIELVGPEDPMARALAEQHRRDAAEFSVERQQSALARHFAIVEQVALNENRILVLLERK